MRTALFIALLFAAACRAQDVTTGLVAWWLLDEPSGTSAADNSGNGWTGSLTNGPTWTAGKIGNCLNFASASSQSFTALSHIDSGAVTCAGWVKMTSTYSGASAPMVVFSNSDNLGSHSDWGLVFNSNLESVYSDGAIRFTTWNDDVTPRVIEVASTQTSWTAGTWYHVAGVDDLTNLSIYVNGVLSNTTNTSRARGSPKATYTTLGYSTYLVGGTRLYLDGALDDWRMWSRALTADQIAYLYSLGNATVNPRTAKIKGLRLR